MTFAVPTIAVEYYPYAVGAKIAPLEALECLSGSVQLPYMGEFISNVPNASVWIIPTPEVIDLLLDQHNVQ